MGATAHHYCLRRIRVYTSSSLSRLANPYQSESNNVRIQMCLATRSDLTLKLKRLSKNSTIVAWFQNHRSFCAKSRKSMADGDAKLGVIAEKKEGEDGIKKLPPPPPEKPLPDDCCGSGCVRCVWDVYYEELEEYNKLMKDDSNSKSESESS